MDKGRRALKLLLIPALLGLAVTLVLYLVLGSRRAPAQAVPQEMVGVVAAKGAIPARTVLSGAMLQVRQMPRSLVGTYELRDPEKAVGQVTAVPLVDGEILLSSKLADKEKGLAYQVPKGKRAATLRVDEFSGVGGYPEVGDSVDLVVTVTAGKEKGTSAQSHLLLQNVIILAKGPAAPPSTSTKAPVDPKLPTSYTLAFSPQQAVQIALAEDISHVKFILRPATDDTTVADPSVGELSLLGPVPAPPPANSKP